MNTKIIYNGRPWRWFLEHAQGPYALPLLAAIAFLNAIIVPIPTELYLAALMTARPARWLAYLVISITASTAGAVIGYFLGVLFFQYIGLPFIAAHHLEGLFRTTQHLLHGHTFFTMALAPFAVPIPEKIFIYGAGFLHVHITPYILGFFLGHGIRLSIVAYLTDRYGMRAFTMVQEYILLIGVGVLSVVLFYGIVHLHLLPL